MKLYHRVGVLAAVITAAPIVSMATAAATHADPCPGKHVQVYNESSNTEVAHFVCGPITGKDGKDGTNGKDGATGPAGSPGTPGATGPVGPQGPAGTNGEPGANGADGATGPAGASGPAGAAGADGSDGEAGATGPVGPKGDDGADGKDGATGPAGTNGLNGAQGEIGPIGPQGEDGIQGIPGSAGESVYAIESQVEGCFELYVDDVVFETDDLYLGSVCDGKDGVDGIDGKDGKDGKSTIVIKHVDGTVEEVPTLPHTGSNGNTWAIASAAGFLLVAGTGTVLVARRRR